ncbi:MAG: hypothetical protein F4Z00_12460 [Acidimicrobiaceae bacterium]|nr:hypothetical protein [Acidimicrobiaceae bacterium]MXZ66339.1 hypothetical protein [Acidimicrobiaceae bacterium]MYF32303.1 hypothetical protein [Acidimicrobiaceae bacterium]MYG77536.1 hypothetical protein [Acidimicrobiaceae bacterium]
MTKKSRVARNAKGGALMSAIIAMTVVSLLIPGLLLLLHRSNRLATAQPDNDEGITARAELAELFGSVDPIGLCASPSAGPDAAHRDRCFREHNIAGASLIEAPALPAANPASYGACWLTTQEDDPNTAQDESEIRQRKCIVLEGDDDEPECGPNSPSVGPCLRVVSTATGEPVRVDRHGGGLLLIRTWDENTTCSSGVPFLPPESCFTLNADPDRLIYHSVEWWCLRWRAPTPDGSGSVTAWTGTCPDPTEPAEWHDPADTATWPQSTPQPVPALPTAVASGPDDGSGTLTGPHTPGDRITDVEVLVCVASTYADRLQGASHCTVDTMRFSVANTDGATPPAPGFVPDSSVTRGGVTVTEGGAPVSFGIRLATAPTADVDITIALTPPLTGVTVTPATLTFTANDWRTPQPVTVTAADETLPDQDDEATTINLTADNNYDGLTETIAVTVTDDDKPGLIVDPASVTVTEGATADIMVQLKTSPAIAVTIDAESDDPTAATVTPSLTFPAGTGQTPQTLTITGVEDTDIANAAATVTLTTSSIGNDYNASENITESVTVTVADDDTPALTLTADSVTVNDTATVDVSLTTQPSDSVTVTVASADPAAATADPPSLTFTTTDWQTAQTVTITGTDDADYDSTTTTVTLTADSNYGNLTASVAVTVTDDDSRFTATDAARYVAARDGLLSSMSSSYAIGLYGTNSYPEEYVHNADFHRDAQSLDSAIPLGEDDPNSLPSPANRQALSNAIDALAVAAGLLQSLIDAAEGG